jgi:hypothetical protein
MLSVFEMFVDCVLRFMFSVLGLFSRGSQPFTTRVPPNHNVTPWRTP